MKKKLLIYVILWIPIVMFGQKRFLIGINVNPLLSTTKIENAQSPSGFQEVGGIGLGHSSGIQIQYGLNKNFFLRSGINYQKTKNRHYLKGYKFASDLINRTESQIQNDINVFSIGLPFEFGCITAAKKEKINFLIGVGGLINIPFATKSEARILHENMEDEVLKNVDNQVNASVFSIGLFTGIELRIRDKFILGIEPNVRITPNEFSLFWFQSKSKTVLETGLMFRLRMMGQKPS